MNSKIGRKQTHIPYIDAAQMDALKIPIAEKIDAIEYIFKKRAHQSAWSPAKSIILPEGGRYLMSTFSAMNDPDLCVTKTLVLNPDNPAKGLPQINGMISLLDAQTGLPLALLDCNWITDKRTAALSATAATYLANPNASSIGFVGCGVQARGHLTAFKEMFPLRHAKIFGRGQKNLNLLAQAAKDLGLETEIVKTGQEAVENVDLIITTITATEKGPPFLDASKLKQGAFAAIVDLAIPWVKDSLSHFDHIIIDDLEQEKAIERKMCDLSLVAGDLSQLIMDQRFKRQSFEHRTAFIFRGIGLGDLALSQLIWTKIKRLNG